MKACWPWVRKPWAAVRSWVGRHWPVLAPGLILAVIVIGPTIWFWPTLKSNGEALRNLALVAAALFGLPLALWRSCVAHKQADTAERGHNNERYQKGADMLGSDVMTTRMGGVYALERLAQEHAHEYHVQIMKLLCSFLWEQTRDGGEEVKAESKELRRDLDAAAQAIGACRRQLAEEELLEGIEGDFVLNLLDANLSGADLSKANLSGANLSRANLSRANLFRANLSGGPVNLEDADLSDANLWDADLSGALLFRANLSGARLSLAKLSHADLSEADLSGAKLSYADLSGAKVDGVKGLLQEELDTACQSPICPPPRILPDGLAWNELAAKARWRKSHGRQDHG